MKKRLIIYFISIYFLGFTSTYGNSLFENIIRMESDQYQIHYKKIVIFPHFKHTNKLNIVCGECHHDADGDPQENLEISDDVDNCIECHSIPSYTTGKPMEVQLEYHTNTLHFKCKGCHKLHNNRQQPTSIGIRQAPIKCYQCHKSKNTRNKNEYQQTENFDD